MGAPVFNSVVVSYKDGKSYKLPGEAADILVDVVDPDGETYDVTITARDSAGNTTNYAVGVLQADPVTLSAVADPGHTVTQDPSQPTRFVTV